MDSFCGQDRCSVDSNGRVKFHPRIYEGFIAQCNGEVVLHCVPEGSLAVYPEDVFDQMRRGETKPAERAASSLVFRRTLRRFGALTKPERMSRQGRITIPPLFREYVALLPGQEAVVVGVEIGVEIWNVDR